MNMTADFVPFVPTPAVKASMPHGGFTPLTSKVASISTPTPACSQRGEMKVELKREGERITQIRVLCRSGELIEIDCEY